ncbi:MAG: hypothetical protein H0T78_02380 [Longispora sp.]|nr:hypothetical protein [Longispora sp. (in: high G+C Gram-positive bacteria)]
MGDAATEVMKELRNELSPEDWELVIECLRLLQQDAEITWDSFHETMKTNYSQFSRLDLLPDVLEKVQETGATPFEVAGLLVGRAPLTDYEQNALNDLLESGVIGKDDVDQ